MITIQITESGEYSVMYRLEGVKATEVLTRDYKVALDEVAHKMRLAMGLHKGKIFTTYTGKEI